MKNLPNKNNLKYKTFKGLSFLLIREVLIKLIAFLGQIIVFRIINPSDFGIFAILLFITGFFDLFSDIGLTFAVIQKKDPITKEEISSVFFIKQIIAFLLFIFIYFLAPNALRIYPQLTSQHVQMIRILSLYLIIKPFRTVLVALLEREINYVAVSSIEILGVFIYQITLIILALKGFAVWSFIYAILLKEAAELIVTYIYKPFVPKISIAIKQVKKMMRFGAYIQGQGIVTFVHDSLSPLIIGTRMGFQAVGYVNFADNITSISQSITDNFGRVAFSSFSKLQQNKFILSEYIEKSISILSIFTVLFSTFIFGFGNSIISLLFTNKWLPALPALYWFCGGTLFLAAMSAIGQGLLVIGKSKEIFYTSILLTIIELPLAFLFVLFYGLVGVPMAMTFTAAIAFYIYTLLAKRNSLNLQVVNTLLPKITIGLSTVAIILMINVIYPTPSVFILGLKIIFALLIYILFYILISPKEILYLFNLLKQLKSQ